MQRSRPTTCNHGHPRKAIWLCLGFAWAWLGAALQATRHLIFGVISVPGGWRYSPVVLAQAIAPLGQMFPARILWVALGSGQALNEAVTGLPWPSKEERNARLREGADVIRALLAGETVTHRGRLSVVDAHIWSCPEQATRLVGAAASEATAKWLGGWADGLLTVGTRPAELKRIVEAFRSGGGEGKPIFLKMDLCFAASQNETLRQAHEQWRFHLLGGDVSWDLCSPKHFETASRFVRPEDMLKTVLISSGPARYVDWIAECAALGFDSIDLHNVGTEQPAFIDIFGERVLPLLRRERAIRPGWRSAPAPSGVGAAAAPTASAVFRPQASKDGGRRGKVPPLAGFGAGHGVCLLPRMRIDGILGVRDAAVAVAQCEARLRRRRAMAPGRPRTVSTRPFSSCSSDKTRALSYTSPSSPCFA